MSDKRGKRGHRGHRGHHGHRGHRGHSGHRGHRGHSGKDAGATFQAFTYVVTGSEPDLSDFIVTLPVPEATDTYKVYSQFAGVAFLVGIDCPNIITSDRTTLTFRVVTTAFMTPGDQIDFLIASPS